MSLALSCLLPQSALCSVPSATGLPDSVPLGSTLEKSGEASRRQRVELN